MAQKQTDTPETDTAPAPTATAEPAAEGPRPAAASAEGGGAWPPELLVRYTDAASGDRGVTLAYTSHEDTDQS